MMTELSLNVLDIAQNSITAGATLIIISVIVHSSKDELIISIQDNGHGMTKEQVKKCTDPFYTSRTTRKVGLGIPFFKSACELTGGHFSISSCPGTGTDITASFGLSHIDRMPLGDMTSTIHSLIIMNCDIDFLYTYSIDERSTVLDTRELRNVLQNIRFDVPDVSDYIKEYLTINKREVDHGMIL